jgi:DNA polymerase-3 subunit gamma/tau
MAEQAGRFGQADLTRAAEIISEGLIQMRGATSPRLLLELMCAQVLLPAASTGEKALLARLERLERQLAGVEGRPGETVRSRPPPAQQAGGRPARSADVHGETAQPRDERGRRPGSHVDAPEPDAGAAREDQTREDQTPEDQTREDQTREDRAQKTGSQARDVSHGESSDGAAARPGPGRDAGPVGADTLRQRWPEILDAVRSERKVAWMLLNTASVQELENGALTIAFPSEGNARGFASSGHDQVLTGVLAAMLGLSVRVRAVSGGPSVPPGRPAPASGPAPSSGPGMVGGPGTASHGNPSGPPAADQPAADQPVTDQPVTDQPVTDQPVTDQRTEPPAQGPPASGRRSSGRPAPDPPAPGPRATGRPAPGPAAGSASGPARPGSARKAASQPENPAPRAAAAPGNGRRARSAGAPGGTSAGSPGSSAGPARSASRTTPPPPQATAFADEEWPDDATGPGGAADDLSGMELIQRQLGGRVIEEIEDA